MSDESTAGPPPEAFLALAERVLDVLEAHHIDALVIGGFALAVHNHPRATDDLDLGLNASLEQLELVRDELERLGYSVTLELPDAADPLGGTLTIEDEAGAIVQLVNFEREQGGFPGVIADALAEATPPPPGSKLRVVPLAHLIALKLYSGGTKSQEDIAALLRNNPGADIDEIRARCTKYRLPTYGLF